MNIGVIDIEMGNIASVKNALEKLGYQPFLAKNSDDLGKADFMILPGVGAFPEAMSRLKNLGLDQSIKSKLSEGSILLGICLGMQLLFTKSYEFGENEGLDLIKGEVLPMKKEIQLIIPHMGWNNVSTNIKEYKSHESDFYFVHSYYCKVEDENDILFKSDYGMEFCSGVIRDNQIFGLQFHPEKSQEPGLKLLNHIIQHSA